MTESEKNGFGKSAMIRYVSGIDQPIYPIAYIKNKIPMAKSGGLQLRYCGTGIITHEEPKY